MEKNLNAPDVTPEVTQEVTPKVTPQARCSLEDPATTIKGPGSRTDDLTYDDIDDLIVKHKRGFFKRFELSSCMQAALKAGNVISDDTEDELSASGLTRHEKIDIVLETVRRAGVDAFLDFCHVLCRNNQGLLVTEVLGLTIADIERQRRDSQNPPDATPAASLKVLHEPAEDPATTAATLDHSKGCSENLMYRNLFDLDDHPAAETINLSKCLIEVEVMLRDKDKTIKTLEITLEDVLQTWHGDQRPSTVRLEGDPGSGKTTWMTQLAYLWSKRFLKQQAGKWKLMVYIPAWSIKGSIEDAICKNLRCKKKDVKLLMELVEDGDGVGILIDAIDEIRNRIVLASLTEYVQDINSRGGPTVFISTRTNLCPIVSKHFTKFLHLHGFSVQQGLDYVTSYFNMEESQHKQTVLHYVANNEDELQTVLCNPLRLHIFCALAAKGVLDLGGDNTFHVAKLFEPLENFLVEREKAKVKGSTVTEEDKVAFYRLCLYGLLADIREFSPDLLAEYKINEVYKNAFLQKKIELKANAQYETSFRFCHEMVFEFFGASYFKSLSLQTTKALLLQICSKRSLRNMQKIVVELIYKDKSKRQHFLQAVVRAMLLLAVVQAEGSSNTSVDEDDRGEGSSSTSVDKDDKGEGSSNASVGEDDRGEGSSNTSVGEDDRGDGSSKTSVDKDDRGEGSSNTSVGEDDRGDGSSKTSVDKDDRGEGSSNASVEETDRDIAKVSEGTATRGEDVSGYSYKDLSNRTATTLKQSSKPEHQEACITAEDMFEILHLWAIFQKSETERRRKVVDALRALPSMIQSIEDVKHLLLSQQVDDWPYNADNIWEKIGEGFDIHAVVLQAEGWFRKLEEDRTIRHVVDCLNVCTPSEQDTIIQNTLHRLLPCQWVHDGNTVYTVAAGSRRWAEVRKVETDDPDTEIRAWCPQDVVSVLNNYTQLCLHQAAPLHDITIHLNYYKYKTLWGAAPDSMLTQEAWAPVLEEVLTPQHQVRWFTVMTPDHPVVPLYGLLQAARGAFTQGHSLIRGMLVYYGEVSQTELEEACAWAASVDLKLYLDGITVVLGEGCSIQDVPTVHRDLAQRLQGDFNIRWYVTADGQQEYDMYKDPWNIKKQAPGDVGSGDETEDDGSGDETEDDGSEDEHDEL